MEERLAENYRVKCEINDLYNNLSKLNADNIQTFRSAYFDLKSRLQFTNFLIFDDLQKQQLQKKMDKIRNSICETECVQDMQSSSFKKSLQRRL